MTSFRTLHALSFRFLSLFCLLRFLLGTMLCADPPRATYIFPAGGQRGTSVDVRIGGVFIHGTADFHLTSPGLAANKQVSETDTTWFEGPMIFKPDSKKAEDYPRDHVGRITIDSNAQLGSHYWQLATAQGATVGRQFIVGNLPEIVEDEIDGSPVPTKVRLPVTINGRIFPREDIDIWTIDASTGESITCEVVAARLGSALDSRLEIIGPRGQVVAENIDHIGTDSFVRFVASESGEYQIRIHDIHFSGLQNYVYRLTVTSGMYVDRVFPLGGQKGTSVDFQTVGQQCSESSTKVRLPTTDSSAYLHEFTHKQQSSNLVRIALSDFPEHVESERHSPSAAIKPPTVLNGRIMQAGEIDEWPLIVIPDEKYSFRLAAAKLGSDLDAVVSVHDMSGKELMSIGSTVDNHFEPSGEFTAPKSGQCIVQVRDYDTRRGGPSFSYRLTIAPQPSPNFEITLPTDILSLHRGAESKLTIPVKRIGGMSDAIMLRVKNLPAGVQAANVTVEPDKDKADLVFKADANARIQSTKIQIVGSSLRLNSQKAAALHRADGTVCEQVLMAVTLPVPFKIGGDRFTNGYAERGTIFRRRFRITRNEGFAGPIHVRLSDHQVRHLQGITAEPITIPPNVNEFDYGIRIPGWLEMNRIGRIVVMAVGEIEDEEGRIHKVSHSSETTDDQIIIQTAPCPIGIEISPRSVAFKPNTVTKVQVTIKRGILAPKLAKVEVLIPDHVQGIVADPISIPKESITGTLTLKAQSPPYGLNMPLTIRASMPRENGDLVFAEAKLDLTPIAGSVLTKR